MNCIGKHVHKITGGLNQFAKSQNIKKFVRRIVVAKSAENTQNRKRTFENFDLASKLARWAFGVLCQILGG